MKLPTVFCTMLFGFSCQYALPAVRNDMENTGDAKKVFFQAHALVGFVYLFVGVIGYWGWGNRVAANVLSSMCESPGCDRPDGFKPGTRRRVEPHRVDPARREHPLRHHGE